MAKEDVNMISVLTERIARLEQDLAAQSLQQQNSGLSRHVSDLPELRNVGRLEAFLSEAPPSAILYSESENFSLTLRRGSQRFSDTGELFREADLILRFRPYKGPGSEIPNPLNPKLPRFVWGFLDLRTLPEVSSGAIKLEDLLEEVFATPAFREGTVFTGEQAIEQLRPELEYILKRRKTEAAMEEARKSRPFGAFKGGLPSLPTVPMV